MNNQDVIGSNQFEIDAIKRQCKQKMIGIGDMK